MNARAQLQTFPYPTVIKIVSILQRRHGEIVRKSLSFNSVTDNTDKQTQNVKLNVFGRPGGG